MVLSTGLRKRYGGKYSIFARKVEGSYGIYPHGRSRLCVHGADRYQEMPMVVTPLSPLCTVIAVPWARSKETRAPGITTHYETGDRK
jgi:hypothetical protein